MCDLFKDLPESIDNIQAITDKIESYELTREVLLPELPFLRLSKTPWMRRTAASEERMLTCATWLLRVLGSAMEP